MTGREDPGASSALDALDAVTQAVEAGAGLPEVVRAAARALDASLILIDRTSAVLAVAARSPADEASLMRDLPDVQTVELRVAETVVGRLRVRLRSGAPSPAVLRVVVALVASEVERVRAPERASAQAAEAYLRAALSGRIAEWEDLLARGRELGTDLGPGASVAFFRAHAQRPAEADWRVRLLAVAERVARATAPGAIAAAAEDDEDAFVLLLPDFDGEASRRLTATLMRELSSSLPGFTFAAGRSSVARDVAALRRAGHEAVLAANVVEGTSANATMAYEELGTYRILLPVLMEDPEELRRFYAETLEPIVAYDSQYETDLVGTLAAFFDADANVNATAARLITHRHTVRYRLERIKELAGHDVGSTDGREKLSLGLKAMRVLGLGAPRGPAAERGVAAGRVRREDAGRRP